MTRTTWNHQPTSGEWNTATNWTQTELPTDTAFFSASSTTSITFAADSDASVESIEFSDEFMQEKSSRLAGQDAD